MGNGCVTRIALALAFHGVQGILIHELGNDLGF